MTDRRLPPEPQTEEEARALLREAQAKLQKQMAHADKQLGELHDDVTCRRDTVQREVEALEALLAKLAPHQSHPAGAYHYARIRALLAAQSSYRDMLDRELAANAANQELARTGPTDDWDGEKSPFKDPLLDPRYLSARAAMQYYFTGFQWLSQLEHLDVLLRAAGGEPAIAPADEAEASVREARAAAFKERLAGNRELQLLVTRLTEEIQTAQALLPWAKLSLARLATLEGAEKRALLQDPDWKRLNAAFAMLKALPETLEGAPGLAGFDFSTPVPEGAVVEEEAPEPELPAEDFDDVQLPG